MTKKQSNLQSNNHLIISTYIRTLCITTVLSLIITIGAMAILFFQNGKSEANKMVNSLQTTFVHSTPNTDAWNASSQQGPSTTFVRIKVLNTKHASKDYYYYSSGTRTFLTRPKRTITYQIKYISHDGLYFYRTRHTAKAVYQVWLSLDYIIRELEIVVLAVVLVALLSSILGVFWIRMAANKVTKPLTTLTNEVLDHLKNNADTPTELQLTVPNTSFEVQQLTISFNKLITNLNAQMLKERQFVANASHELRTPLTAIRGYISLIQRRGKAHPEIVDSSMQFLDSESLRLQQLVETLLTITHNEQLQLTLSSLNLSKLVTETVNDYRKNVSHPLQLNVEDGLLIRADANSIKQIMIALLDNAQKYSPAASPIDVVAYAADEQVLLAISDQGIGITDEQRKHIFDRFYRADQSRSSEIPGIGLGLAIVHQLAELNHIQIVVSDHHPKGTTFTLKFDQN